MAGKAGQRLTQDEVAEVYAYDAKGVARPAKYDGVVFDSASGGGAFYRYATAEEDKAAAESAKAAQAAREADDKLAAKVDAEIAKRAAADGGAVVPPMPQG